MAKVLKGVFGALSLAAVLFAVLLILGVYTALDAAPSYTIGSESGSPASVASGLTDSSIPLRSMDTFMSENAQNEEASDTVSEVASGGSSPLGMLSTAGNVGSNITSNTSTSNSSAGSQSSNSGTKPAISAPSGDSPGGSNNGSSAGAMSPPVTTAPEKTYYPARDEWVESGYWEDVTYAAIYGERAIHGSLCNSCGANISGTAAQHLKDTHHSGYHEGIVGYESYQISPERTVKEWRDTSYWVTHPAYWS